MERSNNLLALKQQNSIMKPILVKFVQYLKALLAFGWPFLRPYRHRLFMGIAFGMLFAASNGLVVGTTKYLVERFDPQPELHEIASSEGWQGSLLEKASAALDPWVPLKGRQMDWRQIFGGIALIALLSALRGSLGFLNAYCMCWASEYMVRDLRCAIIAKLNSLSLGYFQKNSTGDMITHIQTDTSNVQRTFVLGFPDLIREPLTLISVCSVLVFMDWRLSLMTFCFFPLCAAPVIILGKRLKKIAHRQRSATVSQSSQFLQVMTNMRIVQAFGLEKQEEEEFQRVSSQLVRQNVKATVAQRLINPIIETIAGLSFGCLLVYVVFANYEIADLATFLMAAILSFGPVKKISGLNAMFQQTSVGIERLQTLFSTQSDVHDRPNAITLTNFESTIEFRDVAFSYGSESVLSSFNLTLQKGDRLGIVGESGSGKSTLINLLFRFYQPESGQILIDGHDLRDVSLSSLRSQLALVSQDILLFNQSVSANIGYGKRGASEDEIRRAARAAQAEPFISRFPEGYQTLVGEWGSRLSGGQKQRVSLARAFLREAPILVLDEATAALDSESEKAILGAIDRLPSESTIISVAHRLSTLATMNRILVLDQGSIIQEGSFDELLKTPGLFQNLARHQGLI
jgi:subfamily B ATP-binding cassette protein MsbA